MSGIPGVGGKSRSAPVDEVRECEALERVVRREGDESEVRVSSGSKSKSCWSTAVEEEALAGCWEEEDWNDAVRNCIAGRSGFWRLRKGRGKFIVMRLQGNLWEPSKNYSWLCSSSTLKWYAMLSTSNVTWS
jgi:hypothetical protein